MRATPGSRREDGAASPRDGHVPESVYLGCDEPFANVDLDGDGLQDLLVTSVYGNCTSPYGINGPGYGCAGTAADVNPVYATVVNAKFSQRSFGGVVSPFSSPPPQD
jgi:hypothetical protein